MSLDRLRVLGPGGFVDYDETGAGAGLIEFEGNLSPWYARYAVVRGVAGQIHRLTLPIGVHNLCWPGAEIHIGTAAQDGIYITRPHSGGSRDTWNPTTRQWVAGVQTGAPYLLAADNRIYRCTLIAWGDPSDWIVDEIDFAPGAWEP